MPDLTDAIARIVGPTGILTGAVRSIRGWRKLYPVARRAVVRPANTEQVADVVRLCAETDTPVVRRAAIRRWSAVRPPTKRAGRSF